MMKSLKRKSFAFILILLAVIAVGWYFQMFSSAQDEIEQKDEEIVKYSEPEDLIEFRKSVGGKATPVIVLLKDDPVALKQFRESIKDGQDAFQKLANYAVQLVNRQDDFLESLADRGIRARMRVNYARQIDGSIRRVEYRFTYLMNGFVAYVADDDLKLLREQPEVSAIYEIEQTKFMDAKAIDYSLGTQPSPSDRRLAVFGQTPELTPFPVTGHPENPRTSAIDGYEGQGINIAIIDSGVDWRHPMFGGTGDSTALPRVSGNPARSGDNRKVIYYYALSSPGDPTDDFGHGTLVAACAAGFSVDGNTPPNPGYGIGRDGNGVGPTVSGEEYLGTAPQARIMSYKVCGPGPNCLGDIELAMEDAASPYTLVASGDTGPVPVAKPVADVINLSLGDTAGSASGASSVAANNAALNGTIVVASAGNSGPGAGTVGAPAAATMAIAVAASLHPGSTSGSDVLLTGQVPGEICDGGGSRPATCNLGTVGAGPSPEYGPASNANTAYNPIGIKVFSVAGGGDIPQGSVSAHYVYVDLTTGVPVVPASVQNRIALVRFTGTFAQAANLVSTQNPAAILLISNVQSATAVQVIGGRPTYTVGTADADTLIDMLLDGEDNSPGPAPNPANGAVSFRPIRIANSVSLPAFTSEMASFSSRGPNDHPTANYRQIKPDVTAPGVGVAGAATPDGLPDAVLGLANPTGYTKANGTSFSGPITAGAMVLIRQRVRNQLGLDTVNLNDPNYRNKRFEAVTVARALLQNSATNLRTGLGSPQADPAPTSINDLGAGHINVAGALSLRAIMVSPTLLLRDADPNTAGDQREFNMPLRNPPTLDPNGNLEVLLPTASFGNQPVAGLVQPTVRTRKVIIRDLGGGGGVYNLTVANNRNLGSAFSVSFTSDEAGNNPITSVRLPSRGQAVFYVRTVANGAQISPNTEFQWYIYATHASTGQTLRMPFYYRAVAGSTGSFNAPVQTNPGASPGTIDLNGCNVDLDGNYTINWNAPTGTPPIGYRIEEATNLSQIYFDDANTPLVNGANSRWSGSVQWISALNPNTGSLAYFIPNLVQQDESLTMVAPGVALPAGQGASLSYLTNQSTEQDFDFINVELSSNGGPFVTLGTFSGVFVGTREFDLTPYAGTTVRVRFRMTSDLLVTDIGTYIEDIRITTNNFATIADVGSSPLSYNVTGRPSGTRYYRIAGIFSTPSGNIIGPYSNVRCVSRP
ncbi:MAG: S8 family serine peptidase [Pyrinomonadaceae bacterium]|nr:S8 family serine peptidase [Pyrinomonadaceae bacterium]